MRKKYLVGFVAFSSLLVCSQTMLPVRSVSRDTIEERKKTIVNQQRVDGIMRILVPMGATIGVSFFLYRLFFSRGGTVAVNPLSNGLSVAQRVTEIEQSFAAFNKKNAPTFFSYDWFKKQISDYSSYISFGVLTATGNSVYERFFHEDTLEWYVRKKLKLSHLQLQIQAYQKTINRLMNVTDEQFAYHCHSLQSLSEQLIDNVESIAAFMEYQIDLFKQRGVRLVPSDLLFVPHIISEANELASSFDQSCETLKGSSALAFLRSTIEKLVFFVGDLDLHNKRFASVEDDLGKRLING